ncbi:hypothetical protein ACH61_03199 [Rathayibacter tanaceti]|uniref:DNA replication and repair protein RecF n=1 Tax=Rathayibacter tanaceti TaxID=1671680 RepID=A0A162IYQ0_9MICO|nr:hypothetical protein ACH61_03199 [Rathayibacter tanaceti]
MVPIRSAAVRGRVGLVRLAGAADPVAEVRAALGSAPRLLVVDDLDTVTDPLLRDAIRAELEAARAADGGFTLIASSVDADALDDLLPSDRGTLAVSPAAERRAIAKVL